MSIVLYQHPISGHCHRVEALLSILDVPYEKVLVDLTKEQSGTSCVEFCGAGGLRKGCGRTW